MASFAANAWIGMEFSPDGARLATAGFDGVVGLWDPRTGATQLRITHDGQVGGAGFSPDGSHLLATVSRNQGSHAIQIYTMDLEELVSIAEHTVTRGFTEAECQEHLQLLICPSRGSASPTLNGQS
jgi:WD40 repeat protein